MPRASDFSDIMFTGTFRDYQQTVLEHADGHLRDGKIHIVAAPGSGKTILGLELIRRLGAPALVLSPSVTIRQQWGDRFESHFTPESSHIEDYVSYDLKAPSLITSVTYQALHAATEHLILEESEDLQDEPEGESEPAPAPGSLVMQEDFSAFDAAAAMKEAGIKVICLDEAHHLRSEWYKALTAFIKELGAGITIIALTATPPYDSTSSEWKRYVSLCGSIDEEIFVPELVMKETLCPHQDYLYFSFPTESETAALRKYRKHTQEFLDDFTKSALLGRILQAAGVYGHPDQAFDAVLKHESEFFMLFMLAQPSGVELPRQIESLVAQRRRFKKQVPWRKSMRELEGAFQFVMDSPDIFTDEISDEMKKLAAQYGLVERKKIRLVTDKKLGRELVSSMGKLHGVAQIAISEQAHMKDSLRMLILTDYIRREQLHVIGTDAHLPTMGAVPIFECVRRAVGEASRIALLSGSLVIIPDESKEGIATIAQQKGLPCSFKQLPGVAYSEAVFAGSNKNKVAVMTEAFQQGLITILIGTKSLLGEGWDSPCINALILATFVGSFMLSNQMRGRAIRVDARIPDKTANIWHLVTLEPVLSDDAPLTSKLLFSGIEQTRELDGDDWETMVRRFDCFMGPAYSRPTIESGVERIDILKPPFDKAGIDRINAQMVERAQRRPDMAASWKEASPAGFYPVVETASEFIAAQPPVSFALMNALPLIALLVLEVIFGLLYSVFALGRASVLAGAFGGMPALVIVAAMIVVGVLIFRGSLRLARILSPKRTVTAIAEAMLASLRQAGHIRSLGAKIRVTATPEDSVISFGLRQATIHEQNLFAEAMRETLSPIQNPKYVLVKKRGKGYRYTQSYACPSILASNKEDAQLLCQNLGHLLGRFELLYTYTPEGREVLWKCCCRSYINANEEIIRKLTTQSPQ